MLFATTRNQRDASTAPRALREDRGEDGGLYLPYRLPGLKGEDLAQIAAMPFTARIANGLNLLCGSKLTQWDVDFCVGRHPVTLEKLPQKILLCQCWHNAQGELEYMVRQLCARMRQDGKPLATDWGRIAVRMAVLLAVVTQQEAFLTQPLNMVFPAGELYGPVSARYARSWGVPIGQIIICDGEDSDLWELLHRGQLRTAAGSDRAQDLPIGLERLIHLAGGCGEVARYLQICSQGGIYAPQEGVLAGLRQGLHVSVVGSQRIPGAMGSVFSACAVTLSPEDALCHCGLLDWRAGAGDNRLAMIFSERGVTKE